MKESKKKNAFLDKPQSSDKDDFEAEKIDASDLQEKSEFTTSNSNKGVQSRPSRKRGRPRLSFSDVGSTKKLKKIAKKREQTKSNEVDDSDPDRNWKIVLKRQWDIMHLLAMTRPGFTLEELATKFGVSEKTIKRDLKTLEYVFGTLKSRNEAHGRKRYCFDKTPFTFGLTLDRDELLAIYVGQELMTPLRGTYFWEGLQKSREKIKSILQEETVKYAERVAPFFRRFEPVELQYSEQKRKLIDQTLISMVDSCALRIKYRSIKARRSKTYDIYPYNFVYWNTSVYLIGFCCRDRKIKLWKVERLYDAQTLPKHKFSRMDFDVDKFLSNAVAPFVGDTPVELVTIRFTGYAARIVTEEKLRSIQEVKQEPSGAVVVKVKTETGKFFTRWILGFGRHAEILAPNSLRQKFLLELDAVQELYRQDVSDPIEYYAQYERRLTEDRRQNRVLKRLVELPIDSETKEKKSSKRENADKKPSSQS